jgi:hypothetical protein
MDLETKQTSITYQKPEEEEIINPEEYYNESIDKLKTIPLRKLLPDGFIKGLDPNFKLLCREIKKNLMEENYEIIAITGFAGTGKSQLGSLMGSLIDQNYSFGYNINFIPTSKEIEKDYLKLKMYSYLHIDEASRSVHKHKWYEKTQQKLSTLYDTEREGHFICSCLIMPRFQNFTENFRNFFIKYWINIPCRGIAIVYKRDEDKDTKDPWNIDYSIKIKQKYWGSKRIFERSISDIIRMEQRTKNYLFYFTIPEIPKPVWSIYKVLKKQSRIDMRESEIALEVESYKDKLERIKMERWVKIVNLRNQNKTYTDIAVELNMSPATVRTNMRQIEAYQKLKGEVYGVKLCPEDTNNNIYNLSLNDKNKQIPSEFNII